MQVDIYAKEKGGNREIRFPILPERIVYTDGDAEFVTYDIMNRGEVAIPTGEGLAAISWESEFLGEGRQNDPRIRGSWRAPKYYHDILKDWKAKKKTITIIVPGYPFNFDAYVSTYSAEAYGPCGDMAYKIEFKEARDITIKTTKASTASSGSTKRTSTESTTYTIKSGDSLWAIAQKSQIYGDGTQWQKIYNANKDIIESTAKKYGKSSSNNGWWIYPGVTLTIPR